MKGIQQSRVVIVLQYLERSDSASRVGVIWGGLGRWRCQWLHQEGDTAEGRPLGEGGIPSLCCVSALSELPTAWSLLKLASCSALGKVIINSLQDPSTPSQT